MGLAFCRLGLAQMNVARSLTCKIGPVGPQVPFSFSRPAAPALLYHNFPDVCGF